MSPAQGVDGKIEAEGELYLTEEFWKRLEEIYSESPLFDELEQVLQKPEPLDWYDIRDYDLSEARDDFRINDFPGDGDIILVLSYTGAASIKFNSPNADAFDLETYKKIKHSYSAIYLTNTAQSGATIKLLFGRGDWEITETIPEIDLSGTVRNDYLDQITDPLKIGQIIKDSHIIPHADIACEKILVSETTRLDQWRNTEDYTFIAPGKILLHATTKLSDWQHPSDMSLFHGGQIFAHSVEVDKLSVLTHILSGATWTDNSPGAGYVAWSGAKVTYNGATYTIADGNTDKKYIWWDLDNPTSFQTSDTKPAITDDDCIVAYNDSGTHELIWNATLIDGRVLRTGSVTADEIYVDVLSAISADVGTLTAGLIKSTDEKTLFNLTSGFMSVSDGVYIRFKAGKLNGDYGTEVRDTNGVLTIDKGEITERWRKIYDKDITSPCTSFTLSLLNGNADREYWIFARWRANSAESSFGVRPNNDSGNNYGFHTHYGEGVDPTPGNVNAYQDVSFSYLYLGRALAGQFSQGWMRLYAKSGYVRQAVGQYSRSASGTTITGLYSYSGVWNNAGSNITSLVFFSDAANQIGVGTHLEVWKRIA